MKVQYPGSFKVYILPCTREIFHWINSIKLIMENQSEKIDLQGKYSVGLTKLKYHSSN